MLLFMESIRGGCIAFYLLTLKPYSPGERERAKTRTRVNLYVRIDLLGDVVMRG